MNSALWQRTRREKIARNPLCEECMKRGVVTPTQCVHHLTEIESAKTDAEAWELATSMGNLQSLCFACHHEIHAAKRSHSKEAHKQRNSERMQRWIERHTR